MVKAYSIITVVLKAMMKKQLVAENIMIENSTMIKLVMRSILMENSMTQWLVRKGIMTLRQWIPELMMGNLTMQRLIMNTAGRT